MKMNQSKIFDSVQLSREGHIHWLEYLKPQVILFDQTISFLDDRNT